MMQLLTTFCSGWEPPRSFLFALLLLLVSIIAPMPGYPTAVLALWLAYLDCDSDRVIATRHALVEGIVYTLMLATVLLPGLADPTTIRLYLGLLLVLMFVQSLFLWDSVLAGGDTRTFVTIGPILILDSIVFFQHNTYPSIVQWYALARTLQSYMWIRFWDQHHCAKTPYWFYARRQFTPQAELRAWQRAMKNQSFEDVVRSVQIYQEKGNVPRIEALKTMFNGLDMTSLLGYLTTAIAYLDARLEYTTPRQDTKVQPIVLAIKECMQDLNPHAETTWMVARTDQELLDMLGSLGQQTLDQSDVFELPDLESGTQKAFEQDVPSNIRPVHTPLFTKENPC